MPTRGPVLRQVQRPIHTTRGVRREAGTRPAYVSTTTLKRGRKPTLTEILWAPLDTLHVRDVVIDGHTIGQVAAHSPSPYNATRPTRYVFRSIDGKVTLEDTFLDGLRGQIDRFAYPEGAELPMPGEGHAAVRDLKVGDAIWFSDCWRKISAIEPHPWMTGLTLFGFGRFSVETETIYPVHRGEG